VIATELPTVAADGEMLVIPGVTMKFPELLATPTLTTKGPEVAPAGTGATMVVALQLVGGADTPLNVTVLLPCADPKFDPLIATDVPTGPDVGDRLVIEGFVTAKVTPLLGTPPTATMTGPVVAPTGTAATMLVALQLVGVAATPLKATVLVPWVAPNVDPVIVTKVPVGPDVGNMLEIEEAISFQ
jgi:hypothetical protein